MLTQMKFFPALILLLTSQLIWASQGEQLEFKVINDNSFTIKLQNPKKTTIELSIRDIHGVAVHTETIKENQIANKQYNLKALPTGEYSVVIINDQYINIQTLFKKNNKILFDIESSQKMYIPTFSDKLGFLDMNILGASEVDYNVKIQDEEGNILFNENFISESLIQRRFNLTKLEEGQYNITVYMEASTFSESFYKSVDINTTLALR